MVRSPRLIASSQISAGRLTISCQAIFWKRHCRSDNSSAFSVQPFGTRRVIVDRTITSVREHTIPTYATNCLTDRCFGASYALGSRLLPNFELGTFLCEELHVLEISVGEPLHLRKCRPEIGREVVDDFGSPRLLALAAQYFPTDVVIKL